MFLIKASSLYFNASPSLKELNRCAKGVKGSKYPLRYKVYIIDQGVKGSKYPLRYKVYIIDPFINDLEHGTLLPGI